MARRQVDAVDTIWLNMDRPDNLMVIESVMTFDGPMDWDRFRNVLEQRVAERYPVFRQRPVTSWIPFGMPHWEDDPDFDLERHLLHVTLDAPGDDMALQAYVNRFVSTPMLRDKPLWEMHLIDGYDGGSAVYSRLHHSLADGIALVRVMLSMSDAAPDDDLREPDEETSHRGRLGTALHLAELTGSTLLDLPNLLNPRFATDAMTLARQAVGISAKLLFTRNPESPVKGPIDVEKRVVWSTPFPLADVVETCHRTGTTVNDVLVAALAGALSTYNLRHHGERVDIPTMIPVNVRPLDEPLPRELGNRFALVIFLLPSGLGTPFERLAETKRRMDAIKDSPEAVMTFGLIRGIGRTGKEIERFLVDFFANKATGVTTNVPGPRESRYVAGQRIRWTLGWAPESGEQTLGTSIFSYAGQVQVGFKVDAHQLPHPEELLADFRAEVDELLRLAPAPATAGASGGTRRSRTKGRAS
jgi:WS/DGAT/MGAT family acyltransferase